jgi:hypothetical protein
MQNTWNKRLTTKSFAVVVLIITVIWARFITRTTFAAGIAGIIFISTVAVHLLRILSAAGIARITLLSTFVVHKLRILSDALPRLSIHVSRRGHRTAIVDEGTLEMQPLSSP